MKRQVRGYQKYESKYDRKAAAEDRREIRARKQQQESYLGEYMTSDYEDDRELVDSYNMEQDSIDQYEDSEFKNWLENGKKI